MDTYAIKKQFHKMGVRARIDPILDGDDRLIRVDIRRDRYGSFFWIQSREDELVDLFVPHLDQADRHLVLMAKSPDAKGPDAVKFLCGHDERHWFAAAIPETARVRSVPDAKEALKPEIAIAAQFEQKVRPKNRHKRRNNGYIRQGEWFFIPVKDLKVNALQLYKNEPLIRGGKPHMAEELYREGGETVYLCREYPNPLTQEEYEDLIRRRPKTKYYRWRPMRRNMDVYVRGRVSHSDHKTVILNGWHRVVPNTENLAKAFRHLAFID